MFYLRLSEQRRQKVKELEAQLAQHKRRLVDYSKVCKMKEQMAKDLTRVNAEILVRLSFTTIQITIFEVKYYRESCWRKFGDHIIAFSFTAGFETDQSEIDEAN